MQVVALALTHRDVLSFAVATPARSATQGSACPGSVSPGSASPGSGSLGSVSPGSACPGWWALLMKPWRAHAEGLRAEGRGDRTTDEPTDPRAVDLGALRRGDADALEVALRTLMPHVRRWLHRLLGPRPDLDDATQDALLALATALPRFRGDAKLTTFAHRITLRTAYRYFRQRERDTQLTVVPPPADTIDPESRAMDREALRRLYRCLERLPRKRRVAFVLCCIEGFTPAEAAQIAGTTSLAMRSRLSHARAEVARRLDADPYIAALAARQGRGER